MSCLHPIELKNNSYNPRQFTATHRKEYLKVPCGKCINCLAQKSNELAVKFTYNYEHKYNYKGIFLTLTYNDESIHYVEDEDNEDFYDYNLQEWEIYNESGKKLKLDLYGNPIETLKRKDFQLFIKRLRNELKPYYDKMNWQNISYLATSEYGTKGERPHYHAVILGIDAGKLTENIIKLCWSMNYTAYKRKEDDIIKPMGIIDVRPLTSSAGIGYVAKYTQKELEWDDNDPREKPKVWHSTGLDNQIIKDIGIEQLKKDNFIFSYGNRDFKKGYLGKYYIKKFGFKSRKDNSFYIEKMKQNNIAGSNYGEYTNEQIEQFKIEESRIKAEQRIEKLRQKGEGIPNERRLETYQETVKKVIDEYNSLYNNSLHKDKE